MQSSFILYATIWHVHYLLSMMLTYILQALDAQRSAVTSTLSMQHDVLANTFTALELISEHFIGTVQFSFGAR